MNLRAMTASDMQRVAKCSVSRGCNDQVPAVVDYAYAMEDDGVLLAVGGLQLVNPWTAWVWMDWTPEALKRARKVYREIRNWLEWTIKYHGLYRVMAAVDGTFPQAVRTVEHLGFVREAVMNSFFGDHDGLLYGRTR